jgi:hypothetical protein
MSLKKLFPKNPSFQVKALNKTFELNPLTVEDEIWMLQEFSDKIIENLGEMDLITGTRLAFQLMKSEDKKRYFQKTERTFITEDGEEIIKKIGGIVLLQSLLSGQDEQIEMFNAIFQTIINSRPMVDEKKKKKAMKKKGAN